MKRHLLLYCLLCLFIFQGCKKETISSGTVITRITFFDSTIAYLQSSLSDNDFSRLDLKHFEELRFKSKLVGLKIFEKNATADKFLLVEKAPGGYNGSWVDMSALKIDEQKHSTTGSMTVKRLAGEYNATVMVAQNNVVKIIKKETGAISPTFASPLLPEIIIYYRPDTGNDLDFISLYWLLGQNSSYNDYYLESSGGGGSYGGGGGGGSGSYNANNIAVAPTFTSPTKPIEDLKKEVECFTNDNTSSYTISVNVNQPEPNTRDVFNMTAAFPVGHAFLTLDQLNSNGTHTIRNIGFYPKNSVKPGRSVDESIFGEDSNTPFDVSLKIEVSGGEFTGVINNLLNQQSTSYDLDNFNCTTSLLKTLGSIGINLPATKSSDLLFSGNNPADLGEDIRRLDLNKFSQANGNRKIVRNVSKLNDQKPVAKKGSC